MNPHSSAATQGQGSSVPPHPRPGEPASRPAPPAHRHAYGWPADWARAVRCPPTRCWGRRTRWSSARSRRPPAWPPAAASIRAAGALTSGGWILQRWQRKLSLNLLKRTQNKQTNKKEDKKLSRQQGREHTGREHESGSIIKRPHALVRKHFLTHGEVCGGRGFGDIQEREQRAGRMRTDSEPACRVTGTGTERTGG